MKPPKNPRAFGKPSGKPSRRQASSSRRPPLHSSAPSHPLRAIRPIAIELLVPPPDIEAALVPWADRSVAIAAKLMEYLKRLLETNQLFNLTGDTSPEKQWRAHVEDALLCGAAMERESDGAVRTARIADVGSGGGMPGVVWAVLWPEASVTLIEATEKKAVFLQDTARALGLANLAVVCDRAESVGQMRDLRESFNWVTARALAELRVAAEWTVPLCKVGGRVALVKGPAITEELRASRRAFRLLGANPDPAITPHTRSDGKSCNLLIYSKIERTPSPYPRRVGVAPQNPL